MELTIVCSIVAIPYSLAHSIYSAKFERGRSFSALKLVSANFIKF